MRTLSFIKMKNKRQSNQTELRSVVILIPHVFHAELLSLLSREALPLMNWSSFDRRSDWLVVLGWRPHKGLDYMIFDNKHCVNYFVIKRPSPAPPSQPQALQPLRKVKKQPPMVEQAPLMEPEVVLLQEVWQLLKSKQEEWSKE